MPRIPTLTLSRHQTGQFCKRIRGKLHYFGADHALAMARLVDLVRRLEADPDRDPGELLEKSRQEHEVERESRPPTIYEVVEDFLLTKSRLADAGRLSFLTLKQYRQVGSEIKRVAGLTRADRTHTVQREIVEAVIGSSLSPNVIRRKMLTARSIFKHAFDSGMVDNPVRLQAKVPSKAE